MTDKNKGKPAPVVQVIKKAPGQAVAPSTQKTVSPRPVTPGPSALRPAVVTPAPRPAAAPVSLRPSRPAFRPPPGPRAPRAPPTPEAIASLAQRERVPARIAKGELEGKMKCRIWRKLHAEEARRFDQAWTLVEKTPGLDLADAFGIVQSGMSVDEFRARRARAARREVIKEARATVEGGDIDGFITRLIESKTELALVMGERTALDVLTAVQPTTFATERGGRVEKLQLVVLATRATWEALAPKLERDSKLAQKPAPVSRQPSRRPVTDPRAFPEHLGRALVVQLRNGIKLKAPLLACGPFDVLLGSAGEELFVPLHAMLSWQPA